MPGASVVAVGAVLLLLLSLVSGCGLMLLIRLHSGLFGAVCVALFLPLQCALGVSCRCWLLGALFVCSCSCVVSRAHGPAVRLEVRLLGFPAVVCAVTPFPPLATLCNLLCLYFVGLCRRAPAFLAGVCAFWVFYLYFCSPLFPLPPRLSVTHTQSVAQHREHAHSTILQREVVFWHAEVNRNQIRKPRKAHTLMKSQPINMGQQFIEHMHSTMQVLHLLLRTYTLPLSIVTAQCRLHSVSMLSEKPSSSHSKFIAGKSSKAHPFPGGFWSLQQPGTRQSSRRQM